MGGLVIPGVTGVDPALRSQDNHSTLSTVMRIQDISSMATRAGMGTLHAVRGADLAVPGAGAIILAGGVMHTLLSISEGGPEADPSKVGMVDPRTLELAARLDREDKAQPAETTAPDRDTPESGVPRDETQPTDPWSDLPPPSMQDQIAGTEFDPWATQDGAGDGRFDPWATASQPDRTDDPWAGDGGPWSQDPWAGDGGPWSQDPWAGDGGPWSQDPWPAPDGQLPKKQT